MIQQLNIKNVRNILNYSKHRAIIEMLNKTKYSFGCTIKSITIPASTVFEETSDSGRVLLGDATFETITFVGTYEEWMGLNPSMKILCEYTLICSEGSYSMKCTISGNDQK